MVVLTTMALTEVVLVVISSDDKTFYLSWTLNRCVLTIDRVNSLHYASTTVISEPAYMHYFFPRSRTATE